MRVKKVYSLPKCICPGDLELLNVWFTG